MDNEYTQLRLRVETRNQISALRKQISLRDGERMTTDTLLSKWIESELASDPAVAERVKMAVALVTP